MKNNILMMGLMLLPLFCISQTTRVGVEQYFLYTTSNGVQNPMASAEVTKTSPTTYEVYQYNQYSQREILPSQVIIVNKPPVTKESSKRPEMPKTFYFTTEPVDRVPGQASAKELMDFMGIPN